jgi:hypothetical protein
VLKPPCVAVRNGYASPGLAKRVCAGKANALRTASDKGGAAIEPQFFKVHG